MSSDPIVMKLIEENKALVLRLDESERKWLSAREVYERTIREGYAEKEQLLLRLGDAEKLLHEWMDKYDGKAEFWPCMTTLDFLGGVVERRVIFCARCGSDQHELSEGRCSETPGYE